jgi:multimeric flavodoxin WrbA
MRNDLRWKCNKKNHVTDYRKCYMDADTDIKDSDIVNFSYPTYIISE